MNKSQIMHICIGCRQPVVGLHPGVGGVTVHGGHADPAAERACLGPWGYTTIYHKEETR